ncbi:MAG: alpha/beta hydrolase [Rhodospirillales bacterium CG15_BIG_FIL_POST_REV_8_21_14_020_66_15]|nr:MAG: alpha/beta hydrolase [Rhodospirillales bacterium CG15_BIG_FIL_POST_REV_8_21_14_020_66_15]
MTDQIRYIDAAGRRLECAWWCGPPAPDAAVLVFLHEGLGCVDMWRGVPQSLAQSTGMPAFAYSRAGYGRSQEIALPRGVDYHAPEAYEVLPAVLDAAGIAKAVLVGHSDGGTIALMAAGRDARIKGVVTMAAHVFNEDVTIQGILEARKAWDETDLRDRLRRHHGGNVDTAFFGWNDTWLTPEFRAWNVEDCLPAVTCPVLVVQGADDRYGTAAQVRAIASQVSGPARELILPGCGHSPHLEAPDALFAAVNEFVAGLSL